MDFNLSQEQTMIYQYGESLAKTYDRAYWMENAEVRRFPEEMYAQIAALLPELSFVPKLG